MTSFALLARTSTEDLQSPEDSLAWQQARAESLIGDRGEIVAVYHDAGQSRSVPPERRPQASRLLHDMTLPAERRPGQWEAVVVAELARAFGDGIQSGLTLRLFDHYDVGLWHPDAGGRHNGLDIGHRITAGLRAELATEERRVMQGRVVAAMHTFAAQGRYMGGRAPFGYVLVDAGEHPHPKRRASGQRLHRLEANPETAPVVARIFTDLAAGRRPGWIADQLTAEGVPSPSAAREQPHPVIGVATGGAWSRQAVRTIGRNGRYLGSNLYARRRRKERLLNPSDPAQGFVTGIEFRPEAAWVFAEPGTYEPLVDPEVFKEVQELLKPRRRGPRPLRQGRSPYVLRGLIECEGCGRILSGTLIGGTRYLRCRLQSPEYSRNDLLDQTHPKTAYLREDKVVDALIRWLNEGSVDEAAAALAAVSTDGPADRDADVDRWRRRHLDAQARQANLVRVAQAGGDAAVLAEAINEAADDARHAEKELARLEPSRPTTAEEVKALLLRLGDIFGRLRSADPKLLNDCLTNWNLKGRWAPGSDKITITLDPPEEAPGDESPGQGDGPNGSNRRVWQSLGLTGRLGPVTIPLAA